MVNDAVNSEEIEGTGKLALALNSTAMTLSNLNWG